MWASWYHNSRMNANTVHCTIKGVKYPIGVRLWCGLSLRCCTKDDGSCSDWFQTLVAVRWGAFMGSLSLRATPRPQLIIGEDRMGVLPYLTSHHLPLQHLLLEPKSALFLSTYRKFRGKYFVGYQKVPGNLPPQFIIGKERMRVLLRTFLYKITFI